MRPRAFTLIELLVVIAIISILAAILFPVFAQAKVAAKGAASLSNVRQIGTAHMLYAADYDDMAVTVGLLDTGAPLSVQSTPHYSWAGLLMPYLKSKEMFQDPLTGREGGFMGLSAEDTWLYHTQFGYAFTVWSPWEFPSSPGTAAPVSLTTPAEPASTVMFVTKKVRAGQPDWLLIPSPVWGANVVNPPICAGLTCYPVGRWGSDGQSYSGQTFENGGLTGGVAFRKTAKACVVWGDTHATWRSADQLARGTNWTKATLSADVVITDADRYQWDIF